MKPSQFDNLPEDYDIEGSTTTQGRRNYVGFEYIPDKADWALDGGCGKGTQTTAIASYVKNVVGMDISKNRIELAKIRKEQKGVKNVAFVIGDLEHPPFSNSCFDFIICKLSLHQTHLEISLPALRNLVANNGIIFIKDIALRFPKLHKYRWWLILTKAILIPVWIIRLGPKKAWKRWEFELNPKWLRHKTEANHLSKREFEKQYSLLLPGSKFPRKGTVVWKNGYE